jgi:hypothetical protein
VPCPAAIAAPRSANKNVFMVLLSRLCVIEVV